MPGLIALWAAGITKEISRAVEPGRDDILKPQHKQSTTYEIQFLQFNARSLRTGKREQMSIAQSGITETKEIEETPNGGSTTIFTDNTPGSVAEPIGPSARDEFYQTLADEPGSKDIVAFLSKPSLVASGSLSSTDTGAVYYSDPWAVSLNGNKANKLAGVYLTRFTAVVTLHVNANKFQAGRYILCHVPSGGAPVSDLGYLAFARMHLANLTTMTQLPHVEIDLATQTHVTLRIPFQSAYNGFVVGSTLKQGLGNVYLYPYSALVSTAGSTTAGYTVYVHFEDVILSGAANNQADVQTVERKQGVNQAPISGALAKISKASSILGQIPLLFPMASNVSWASDIMSRAAHTLGWAKPLNLGQPQRVQKGLVPYIGNVDQVSTAQPLSYVSTNATPNNIGLSQTDLDEMSFDFLKKQWAYLRTVSWTTTNAYGDNLDNVDHRGILAVNFALGETHPPFSFISRHFNYWRGGLKFRYKIAKTGFHTGRLLIVYNPSYRNYTAGAASDERLFRTIVDIRDINEFEVEVPYLSPELWTDMSTAVGKISIYVLEPLVAPATVSSTIKILIEVCAADDFSWAFPAPYSQWEPYAPAVSQSGEYEEVGVVKLGSVKNGSHTASKISIGEQLLSFRQLVKRFLRNTYTASFSAAGYWLFSPFNVNVITQPTSNVTALKRGYVYADLIDMLSPCYVFSTGSIRLTLLPSYTSTNDYAVGVGLTQGVGDSDKVNAYAIDYCPDGGYRTFVVPSIEGVIDVNVPSYHRLLARINCLQMSNHADTTLVPSVGRGCCITSVAISDYDGDNTTRSYKFSRMAGEDFSLSGWVGTVPIVLRSAA